MRTLSKIVLIIIIITLLYSVAKLISANANKSEQLPVKTSLIKQNNQSTQNNQNQPVKMAEPATQQVQNTASMQTQKVPNTPKVPPTPDTPNAQGLYQADEILIDGQGQAGQNYIDITSDTPITPQNGNNTQNGSNTQDNNNGGAYAEASVSMDNTNTPAQNYAPGVPAFEVIDGN